MGLPRSGFEEEDGGALSQRRSGFCEGCDRGHGVQAQIAAFSMAVYFQDLNVDERVALTMGV